MLGCALSSSPAPTAARSIMRAKPAVVNRDPRSLTNTTTGSPGPVVAAPAARPGWGGDCPGGRSGRGTRKPGFEPSSIQKRGGQAFRSTTLFELGQLLGDLTSNLSTLVLLGVDVEVELSRQKLPNNCPTRLTILA
jgi:hypothetical protein